MMPVPMIVGQFEQARQYFLSCPHLDHHVAMDRASAETLKIFAPQLGPRAWAGLSAVDKLSLMREVVLEWRRQAGIFFETFRQMAPVDECFRTNEGRATTWTEVKLQLEKGTQKMFDASSADRVHADLYARTGGCLCWGTWALALAPSAYEQWSREIFPVLRPFGADHVQRGMRKVDEIHDSEYQRQSRCHQEQQQTKLQSVEDLHDEKRRIHRLSLLR